MRSDSAVLPRSGRSVWRRAEASIAPGHVNWAGLMGRSSAPSFSSSSSPKFGDIISTDPAKLDPRAGELDRQTPGRTVKHVEDRAFHGPTSNRDNHGPTERRSSGNTTWFVRGENPYGMNAKNPKQNQVNPMILTGSWSIS